MKVLEMYFHEHRQECHFNSLEGVFTHIIDNYELQGEDAIPFAIKLGDDSVVNFNFTLLNYAFAKGRVDEEELLNMLKNPTQPVVRQENFDCTNCENPYPHHYKDGGGHCEDCGYKWKASNAPHELNQEEIDGMIIKTYPRHE